MTGYSIHEIRVAVVYLSPDPGRSPTGRCQTGPAGCRSPHRGVAPANRTAAGMSANVTDTNGKYVTQVSVTNGVIQVRYGLEANAQLAEDVTARGVRTARGHVDAMDTPGLGIDVDEARVRSYRA